MKALLKFDLNRDEDKRSFELVSKVENMHSALLEMHEFLREITKYANDDIDEKVYRERENIREKFYEILSDNDVPDLYL